MQGKRLAILLYLLIGFIAVPIALGYVGWNTQLFHPVVGAVYFLAAAIIFVFPEHMDGWQAVSTFSAFCGWAAAIAILGAFESGSWFPSLSAIGYGTRTIIASVLAAGVAVCAIDYSGPSKPELM